MNAQIYTPKEDAAQEEDAAQDRRKLMVLLDQAVDAMPEDTDRAEYASVAYVLVAETLGSAARLGLLPMQNRFGTLTKCRIALHALPPAADLATFQAAAKTALRTSIR